VNDKAVNLLDKYDLNVNRVSKGRGTLICDTDKGMYVLKEYKGRSEKLQLLDRLQSRLSDNIRTDTIVRTNEDELYVKDLDNVSYILTRQLDGKECSYKSHEDILKACSAMARVHLKFMSPISLDDEALQEYEMPVFFYADEMEKHTTECRHVKNYLKKRPQKTDFERALLKEYDYFLEKAMDVTKRAKEESKAEYEAYVRSNSLYCHGDFQYHNVIFGKDETGSYTGIINMEHLSHDAGARDFYLFFRKISQKYDWSLNMAESMIDAYQSKRTFPPIELRSLKLRLEYPEKFWKIINFYFNSRKSWMPDRNNEKLDNLIRQEKNKERLIRQLF
jgi:CotS family spore coat protein